MNFCLFRFSLLGLFSPLPTSWALESCSPVYWSSSTHATDVHWVHYVLWSRRCWCFWGATRIPRSAERAWNWCLCVSLCLSETKHQGQVRFSGEILNYFSFSFSEEYKTFKKYKWDILSLAKTLSQAASVDIRVSKCFQTYLYLNVMVFLSRASFLFFNFWAGACFVSSDHCLPIAGSSL